MKRFLALLGLMLSLTGCQTALVFTGHVDASDERQALSIVSGLESDLKKEGFVDDTLPGEAQLPHGVVRIASWWNPKRTVSVEAIAKKKEVSLRIVPQPGANDASKTVAKQVRAFLVDRYPRLKVEIVEKPEADFLR